LAGIYNQAARHAQRLHLLADHLAPCRAGGANEQRTRSLNKNVERAAELLLKTIVDEGRFVQTGREFLDAANWAQP